MSAYERALGTFGFYGAALRHLEKRMAFEEVRAYLDASTDDRTKGNWKRVDGSVQDLTRTSRRDAAERAEWLWWNDGIGRHVIDVLTDNTIGTGITTQAKVQYSRGDPQANESANTKIEDLKERWMEQADAFGQLHWYEMQALWLQRVATVGDVLLHTVHLNDPGRVLSLAYEMIEASRLTDYGTSPIKGNEVQQGVELDPDGRVVAYHVEDGTYRMRVRRLEAAQCRLGFRVDRPGQIRGITWMAPIMSGIWTHRDLVEYTMIARKVQAAVAVIVADSPRGGKALGLPGLKRIPGASATTSLSEDPKRPIAPGMMHYVGEGSVTALQPSQNHDFEPLTRNLLRGIGVGFGFSYEWVSGDYQGTSYAGGRLANQEARRRIRPVHTFVCEHLERPVHRDFIDAALAFGKMPKPPTAQDQYAARFSKPHWEWGVNPSQEVSAAVQAVDAGLSTYRDEIESRGGDWQEFLKQVSSEVDFGEAVGLKLYQNLRTAKPDATGGRQSRTAPPARPRVAVEIAGVLAGPSVCSFGDPVRGGLDFIAELSDSFAVVFVSGGGAGRCAEARAWLDSHGYQSTDVQPSGTAANFIPCTPAADPGAYGRALDLLYALPYSGGRGLLAVVTTKGGDSHAV